MASQPVLSTKWVLILGLTATHLRAPAPVVAEFTDGSNKLSSGEELVRVCCNNSAVYALLLELSSWSSAGIIPAPTRKEFRSFVTRGVIRSELERPWSPVGRSIATVTETVGVRKYSSSSGSVHWVYELSVPREDLSSKSLVVGEV